MSHLSYVGQNGIQVRRLLRKMQPSFYAQLGFDTAGDMPSLRISVLHSIDAFIARWPVQPQQQLVISSICKLRGTQSCCGMGV